MTNKAGRRRKTHQGKEQGVVFLKRMDILEGHLKSIQPVVLKGPYGTIHSGSLFSVVLAQRVHQATLVCGCMKHSMLGTPTQEASTEVSEKEKKGWLPMAGGPHRSRWVKISSHQGVKEIVTQEPQRLPVPWLEPYLNTDAFAPSPFVFASAGEVESPFPVEHPVLHLALILGVGGEGVRPRPFQPGGSPERMLGI